MNITLVLIVSSVSAPMKESAGLPPNLREAVTATSEAYERGQPSQIVGILGPVVEKVQPGAVERMSVELRKQNSPGVAELLATSRLTAIQQNLAASLPPMGFNERLIVAPELRAIIDNRLEKIDESPYLNEQLGENEAEPKAKTLDAFEERLWNLHVLDNQARFLERTAHFVQKFAAASKSKFEKRLTEKELETLDRAAKVPVFRIYGLRAKLVELEMVTRLHRLRFAVPIVTDTSNKVSQRMEAAFAVAHDSLVLQPYVDSLRESPTLTQSLSSSELKDPDLADTTRKLSSDAKTAAGSLWDQSQRLFAGLHWWVRGRFGQGPDFGGLAKSTAALNSRAARNWLYMPLVRKWEDKTYQPEVMYERRHHSTWSAQDRRVETNTFKREIAFKKKDQMQLSTFW